MCGNGAGVVVQPEVAGGVDAGVAVREVDRQGLALGDEAQDLRVGGLDAEAVRAPLLHVFTLEADMQRAVPEEAQLVRLLHALRVGDGIPVEGELARGTAA